MKIYSFLLHRVFPIKLPLLPFACFLLGWAALSLSGEPATAQSHFQEEIDSLLRIVHTFSEDTSKVRIYGDLSFNYAGTRTKLDSAHAYADSVRLLSEKLGYEPGIIQSHLYYGYCDRYQGNYADALAHFQTYVDYYKKTGDELMEAQGWFQLANIHQELGNYDQSLAACEYALEINEKNERWNGVAANLNSIGIIYKRTGKYEQAIACYQRAIAVNERFQLGRDLTYVFLNMGNSYVLLKEYDKALVYYQKSLTLCYAADNEYGIAANLTNMGDLYNFMNQHRQALEVHTKALRIREQLPNKTKRAHSLISTGNTYIKLNDFASAKKHLEEGLVLAQEISAKAYIRDAYRFLTDLYVASDNYRQAYKFEKLNHAMQDSIFDEGTIQQINELQTKYETAEKDKQIALLAKEKEIQSQEAQRQAVLKRTFLGGFTLVSTLAALLIYLFRQRLKNQQLLAAKNEEIKQANFKQQLSELEMKALRAQMNPHFIFNCINSINRMVLSGEGGASRYLTKFAKLIRLMLENSETPTVSLEDELLMLEAYLQLESLRFKEKIRYEIVVDDTIDRETTCLPAMVLQPFIENAIWHGLMPKEGDGQIKITIQEEEEVLKCIIEDNGVGREQALALATGSVVKKKSMGLQITEERLRLLSTARLKELVRITDLKDSMNRALGTRVDVLIPIS